MTPAKLSPLLTKSGKTFCVFFLLIVFFFVLPPTASSQDFPPEAACSNTTTEDNYHSLRPFPFSPCDAGVSGAIQCGNTVYVSDTITKLVCPKCWTGTGPCTCSYHENQSGNVTIDFSNSELPIVGNTEDVANWDVSTDKISDVEKVNRYVSWYLNGVINRAEYSFLSWKKREDVNKIINFSGPIRKLLPQRTQDDSREKQVAEVLTERHNQVVACTYGLSVPLTDIQILAIPGPCKDLGIVGWVFQKKRMIINWRGNLPPKREEFDEFKDYYKEYRRWRGDICLSFEIPFLGGVELMLCFDNPLDPNFYGDLYPYIPFTSTEDRVGMVEKEVPASINIGGVNNLKLSDISYHANDLKLYYAHMQETVELSDLLKKSYVPKEGTGGEGETTPVEIRDGCQILNIRTNDGDHLVNPGWNENKKTITGDLKYTADFDCTFQAPATSSACTVNPVIPISLNTLNPLHDELWHNLVAGADSIFRRIFPKTGNEAPVMAPKDIPGMTKFESSSNKYSVSSGGEIYFPHLGGVSEYFLKAIQTALRPKGYGETFDRGGNTAEGCLLPGHQGKIPPLPGGTGACAIKNNTLNLPDNLIKAIETAAESYKVPPSLMVGVMYGEGAFNPGSRFFDSAFVENQFKECVKLPGCNPNASDIKNIVPFFPQYWVNLKDAVKIVDSERVSNACNLLDGIFAVAKDLSQSQYGSSAFAGKTCFGITLNSGGGGSASCSWDESDAETAIRVWEFGTAYDNATLSCATKENSCLLGGGLAAQCPTGGDTCETKGNRYTKRSHNGCIWDVYKNN
ncbi:MAG: hypothetical protein ABIJ85_02760 [bacterium]